MFFPTSIADFLACQHLTALNLAEAAGQIEKPYFADSGLDLLIRLGLAHEQAYLKDLAEGQAHRIVRVPTDVPWKEAAAQTVAAIHGGAEVIYQATFLTEQWQGLGGLTSRSLGKVSLARKNGSELKDDFSLGAVRLRQGRTGD